MGGKSTKPLVFLLSIIIAILYAQNLNADILIFGNNSIARCPASEMICSCGDISGEAYRCDNSDFNDTLENSITIDDCDDGSELAPNIDYGLYDYYEMVKEISREDLNNTNEKGLNDPYLRAGDNIKITVTFLCAVDGDAYSILYKNNTNGSLNDWQLLQSGMCYSDDYMNYLSQLVAINSTKKLDSAAGNHTIRAIISYSEQHPEAVCGKDFDDPDYSDTDDLIIEVYNSLDTSVPEIEILSPTESQQVELISELQVPVIINITDQTGIDTVNISLTYNNITITLNATNISGLFYTNISNLTNLGLYSLNFWANDTVPENNNTKNHINNYTSTYFYLKNDVYMNIQSPIFNHIYAYNTILLDFLINDINLPYNEVYYILNNNKTAINESKHLMTENSTCSYLNNSGANLSQSFIMTKNITIINIGLLIKRFGSSNKNSSLFLIEDSAGPFGSILAKSVFTNVSNQSFQWKKVVFNQTVNISDSVKYWAALESENSTDYIYWSYNNSYSGGESYNDNSSDLNIKIYNALSYNVSLDSNEGTNTLYVCENNSFSNEECSYSQYYVDLNAPYYSSISYTNEVELGSTQQITADVKDSISSISSVILIFNNSNIIMTKISNIPNGGRYRTNLNNLDPGNYNFSLFANDSQGWHNQTEIYNFSVNDTSPPSLLNISYYPNSSGGIDPGNEIKFNFTLFDYSSLEEVIFLFKPNTTGIWQNISLNITGDSLYSANFTPIIETQYHYKTYAKDIFLNELYSNQSEIDVLYERYWSYLPLIYDTIQVDAGQTLNIYNVTIKNYGDVTIPFSIAKGSGVSYTMIFSNNTFNISKDQNITLLVNITAPATGTYPSNAIITCQDNCQTKQASIGDSIIVGGDGPFLDLKIYKKIEEGEVLSDQYNLRFNDYEYTELHELIARVKNVAELYPADNITFKYHFPNSTDWISQINNSENLTKNFSLEKKNFDDTKDINIKFLIDRKTRRDYLFNLSITANLIYNGSWRNFSHTVKINVTSYEEEYNPAIIIEKDSDNPSSPPEDTTPKLSGSSASSLALGLGAGLTLNYNLSVLVEPNVNVLRGTNKTIKINISNPFKNKYFSDIKLSIIGYYPNQIFYNKKSIEKLNFNKTEYFNITFNAPSYLGYSVNKIGLYFSYVLVSVGQNISSGENLTTSAFFNLIINEVDRNESIICLQRSLSLIKNATLKNYSADILNKLLENQRNAIAVMDFTLAKKICDDILENYESIVSFDNRLRFINDNIKKSITKGYNLKNVLRLYNITLTSFNNGEYSKLNSEIKDLENAYLLQINLENASIIKRLKKFIKNNLIWIIIYIIILGIFSNFMYLKIHSNYIKNKIINLKKELPAIHEEIKKLQDQYFNKKNVSLEYYNLHNEKNREMIAIINEKLANYNSLSLKFNKNVNGAEALETNKSQIQDMIKNLQNEYYIEKNIDQKSYNKIIENYEKELAQIKKKIILADKEKKEMNLLSKNILKLKDIFMNMYRFFEQKLKNKNKNNKELN